MSKKIDGHAEKLVLVIYTGGTIGMVKNDFGALAPIPNTFVGEIRNLPQMHDSNYHCQISCHTESKPLALPCLGINEKRRVLYRVLELNPLQDSSNMSVKDWISIAKHIENNYYIYDGFVVLHGTDTLAYTASALSFMLQNLGKTVIVTGSQVPIFETRTDGLNNFVGSLIIAGTCKIPEVGVFFQNRLLRGNRTVKVHSLNISGAFDSPNHDPLAVVVDGNIHVKSELVFVENSMGLFSAKTKLCNNVALLRIFPTITAAMVEAFVRPPTEGVVLLTYGAGNMADQLRDVTAALAAATARGVLIVNCTQCFRGSVRPIYATNQVLVKAGVIAGYDMTPESALTKLCYVLSKNEWDLATKRNMMEKNLRGELTPPPLPQQHPAHDINYNHVSKIQ